SPTAGAGGSFTSFKTGLSNVSVKFLTDDPSDSSHLRLFAAGGQFGVATSIDQGANWSPQSLPTACATPAAMAYNSTSAATLFLVCQGVQGVFVGKTAGTAWTFHACGSPSSPLPAS